MLSLNRLRSYANIWWMSTSAAAQEAFINRWTNLFFLFGKTFRLVTSFLLLYLLKERSLTIGEYTSDQVFAFFITYNIVDVTGQMLYRGVYFFTNLLRTGEFDFYLAKPINPLFRALTGRPDFVDAVFLPPLLLTSGYLLSQLDLNITGWSVVWYLVLMVNSLVILTALHIMILAIAIMITDIDHLVWTYRDLTRLGQFPVTMYLAPVRWALFFILPVGMMITVPAQVLMNAAPSYQLGLVTGFGTLFFVVSLYAWKYAVRQYSSASS